MPPFTTNTIYYDPLTNITSTSTTAPTVYTTSGPTISFRYENTEEKMKEYCDKVDQHVDKLEEDIEFFNTKREEQEQVIAALRVNNTEYDRKIEELEKEKMNLEGYVHWLESRIEVLEEKIK